MLLVPLIALPFTVNAQSKKIAPGGQATPHQTNLQYQHQFDSLQAILAKPGLDPALQINALIQSARFLRKVRNNIQQAYLVADSALRYSQRIRYSKGMADSYLERGIAAYYLDNTKGLDDVQMALSIFEKLSDQRGVAYSCSLLGMIYIHFYSQYATAIPFIYRSYAVYESIGDTLSIRQPLAHLATAYQQLEIIPVAKRYWLRVFELSTQDSDQAWIGYAGTWLAELYIAEHNIDSATLYLRQSERAYQALSNTQMSTNLQVLALKIDMQKVHPDLDKVISGLNQLIVRSQMSGDVNITLDIKIQLAQTFVEKQDYRAALGYCQQAYTQSCKYSWGQNHRKHTLHIMAFCYEALGEHRRALDTYKEFAALKDSITNTQKFQLLGDIQKQFELGKKDAEIFDIQKKQYYQEILLKQEQYRRLDAESKEQILQQLQTISHLELEKKERLLRENIIQNDKIQNELKFLQTTKALDAADARNRQLILLLVGSALVTAIGFVIVISKLYQVKKKEAQNLTTANTLLEYKSQIIMLESQLAPHFLFNCLSVLGGLITRNDKREAISFLQDLAFTYRYVLNYKQEQIVPLAMELEFITSYIHLLQTRFQDGLHVTVDIDQAYHHYQIPPMTIQLLLENAVKHNIATRQSPLLIHISMRHFEDNVWLEIRNNLQPKPTRLPQRMILSKGNASHQTHSADTHSHIGLDNLKMRYKIHDLLPPRVVKTETEFIVSVMAAKNLSTSSSQITLQQN